MDVIRDVLFDISGEEYVKVAPARAEPSVVASTVQRETLVSHGGDDENASKVVSSVLDSPPANSGHLHQQDDLDSIGPDDSVSCADFAEKQHRQLDKMRAASSPIPEDDERSSKTSLSLSLSSVSITEKGPVVKRPPSVASSTSSNGSDMKTPRKEKADKTKPRRDFLRKIEENSEISHSSVTEAVTEASEASLRQSQHQSQQDQSYHDNKYRKSRSYITSLTNDTNDSDS